MSQNQHFPSSPAQAYLVLCGSRGGYGYVLSDLKATITEALDSARSFGGTARQKGYTLYEFPVPDPAWSHQVGVGVGWEDDRSKPVITHRNRNGRVLEKVQV